MGTNKVGDTGEAGGDMVYDKLVGSRCNLLLYTRDRAGTEFKVKKENKLSQHTGAQCHRLMVDSQ